MHASSTKNMCTHLLKLLRNELGQTLLERGSLGGRPARSERGAADSRTRRLSTSDVSI
jgi:hypothetical protein